MVRNTRGWLSLGVIALLALLTFSGGLLSTRTVLSYEHGDLGSQFLDWRAFGWGEIRNGRLPLWNPHLFGGAPFLGGFQSALLYPPNGIFLVLPLNQAVNWSIALHVFLAGAFTYAWTRRRGLRRPACVLAAAMFMFGGAHIGHVAAGHLPNLCTLAWAPLVFLVVDALHERPSLKWTLIGMCAAAMTVLAGHPQYVCYLVLAAAIYSAALWWQSPHRAKFLLCVAAVAIGGVCLSAVQLFTALQEFPELVRRNVGYRFASQFSFPPENLLTLLSPTMLGTTTTYWGRWYPWEMSIFVGVAALVLAVVGASESQPARRRFTITMTAVLVLLALGAYTPVFDLLYAWLPGFGRFRGTGKFMIFATLFLTMAAAIGADALLERRHVPGAIVGTAAAGACVLGAAAVAVFGAGDEAWWRAMLAAVRDTGEVMYAGASSYDSAEFLMASARATSRGLLISSLTLGVVALLLALASRSRIAAPGLIALAIVEPVVFARATLETHEPVRPEVAAVKDTIDAYVGDFRILNTLTPNSAMAIGARDVWGYDANVLGRYAQLVGATQGVSPDEAGQSLAIERDHPLFDLLRCRFIFSVRDRRLTAQERPRQLPHALLVSSYRVITDRDGILAAVTHPRFDPTREVILEEAPDPRPLDTGRPGTVRVTSLWTDELVVAANLQSPALLLITDTYARGWRVRPQTPSAQTSYRILPANYALRAIPLAAGQHQLHLEYLPSGFVAGRWVSIVSVGLVVGLVALSLLRRRRRRQEI